ncbi:MAG: hypothetical protein N3B15_01355 [Planctomycetota bacterium]|nr:hypothetical protein [Planctomycetota bacterium]
MQPVAYFCLLSDYPIASVQAIVHLKPQRVILISSSRREMAQIEQRVRRVLEQKEKGCGEIQVLGGHAEEQESERLSASSMHQAREWMQRRVRPLVGQARGEGLKVIANITGSTKAAAMALAEAADWDEVHYTAEDARHVIEVKGHPDGKVFALPPLALEDELELLNDEVRWRPDAYPGIDLAPFARVIYDDVSDRQRSVIARYDEALRALWGLGGKRPDALAEAGIELLGDGMARIAPGELADFLRRLQPLDPEACRSDGDALIIPRDRDHRWCRFIIGDWWEHLVAHWLAASGVSLRRNCELVTSGGVHRQSREADIVFRAHDGVLSVVECKVQPGKNRQLTELAKVLNDLVDVVGKTRGHFALSPCFWWELRSDSDWQAKEEFERACKQRGIKIASSEKEIRDWAGSRRTDAAPEYLLAQCSAQQLIDEMEEKLLSWKERDVDRIQQLRDEIARCWPQRLPEVESLLQRGELAQALIRIAYSLGARGHQGTYELLRHALALALPPSLNSYLQQRIVQSHKKGRVAFQRRQADQQRLQQGGPLSTVRPRPHRAEPTRPVAMPQPRRRLPPPPAGLHPNDIRALAPRPRWRLLLDETGERFGEEGPGWMGRFVGLLVDAAQPGIQPLPRGWHACAIADPAEIDAAVQQVLDAPCGVIGLRLDALPSTPGERWFDGMRAILDWVLRLLPLDGPTTIHVVIEARPPFCPGSVPEAICRDALAMLARAWPERAAAIDLRIDFAPKDGDPLLPHVDALAFTWGSPSLSSKERLRRSGLARTCLLEFSAAELAACWDAWDQPDGLSPQRWAALLNSDEASHPASIASAIIAATAAACRSDLARWRRYLAEAQRQLGRGHVDLRLIGSLVDWLQQAKPDDAALPPALRLAWLTVNLARANHLGAVEGAWSEELAALSARLQDEDAPLCCHADLHRAVSATNRFDFAEASRMLVRWQGVAPAVVGLRRWGQLRSSEGQHRAFLGDFAGARRAFAEAIAAFERLSDPEERARELDQTRCYDAIAAMDDPEADDRAAKAALEAYLGALPEAVPRLAASGDDERYRQHTLLRYLVHRPDQQLADAYLGARHRWQEGFGHPWPLIQLYRAILLRDREADAARDLALQAATLAFAEEQGPVVHMIGACCRALAVAWGTPWPEAESALAALRAALPLAAARLEAIGAFVQQPGPPLALLRSVLPFNFR